MKPSKELRAAVRERVRQIHEQNVALSKTDPTMPDTMHWAYGYGANAPAPEGIGRYTRRKLERRMLKRITKLKGF